MRLTARINPNGMPINIANKKPENTRLALKYQLDQYPRSSNSGIHAATTAVGAGIFPIHGMGIPNHPLKREHTSQNAKNTRTAIIQRRVDVAVRNLLMERIMISPPFRRQQTTFWLLHELLHSFPPLIL